MRRTDVLNMFASMATIITVASVATAQELRDVPITGQSLGGFVIPVEPVASEIVIDAVKGWAWDSDDTKRLQVEGDVRIRFGGYYFSSDNAVIWINRIPSAQGVINQIAVYFDEAKEPTRRAGLGASGNNLLVTGSTRGDVTLSITLIEERLPPDNPILRAATIRVRDYLQSVARGALLQPRARVDAPEIPVEPPLTVGDPVKVALPAAPLPAPTVRKPVDDTRIFAPSGTISFSARSTTIESKENCVMLSDNVLLDYSGPPGENKVRELQLSADRAVIFLAPKASDNVNSDSGLLDAKDVTGIYLEGDVVATDFQYTLRGRRIYYDLERNQAVVMDAVMRTSTRVGLVAYARADEMRQLAADEFTAENARVSTSEFFTPHLSVGVQRLTISQQPESEDSGAYMTGTHATLRANGTPFFYWPYIAGSPNQVPIKTVNVGFQDYRGAEIDSEWDLYALMGIEKPAEVSQVTLLQEAFTKNAAGLGLHASANIFGGTGNVKVMGYYDFQNEEQTAAGGIVTSPDRFRGELQADWKGKLARDVTLNLQLSDFSDQNYVSTFRWDDYLQRREYESSGFLNWQDSNNSLSLLVKYNPNDFLSNAYMIASRPYAVNKFPELNYQRYGESLFGDRVTWTQNYSANMMNLKVNSGTPGTLGIDTQAFSMNPAFSTAQSIQGAYAGAGYDDSSRVRVYTRQELSVPLTMGIVKIAPFVHGQVTGYILNNFQDYSSNASDIRTLLGGGSRFSTEFTSRYNSVRSAFLDLNRLHHVVQPNAMLWYGWNSNSVLDMPVYDQEIEATSGAAVAQAGITNKLQTMRGGPGNWRSVDWVVLDVGAVVDNQGNSLQPTTTATDPFGLQYAQSPMPSFYSWRPEYSQWGDHIYASGSMQCSDALSLYGHGVYLLQDRGNSINSFGLNDLGRGTLGGRIQQSPDVSFFLEYRYVNTFDSSGQYPADEFVQAGMQYQLTKKYSLTISPQYDLVANNFRAATVGLTRTFPDFYLSVGASFNQIVNNTTFFASIRIPGAGGGGVAVDPSQPGGGLPGFSQPE